MLHNTEQSKYVKHTTEYYNNQSWSRMLGGTISPKASHFQIKNKACQVSDERNFCEPEGRIVLSHIVDHH